MMISISILLLYISLFRVSADYQFCPSGITEDSNTSNCYCANTGSSILRQYALHIDCSYKSLNEKMIDSNLLPLSTEALDLSWNEFEYIPQFIGNFVRTLIFTQNRIKAIDDRNFAKIRTIRHLDLSWNKIELISVHAFADLDTLQYLDMSHNYLKKINSNVFSHLTSLEDLNMSWNRNLNKTMNIDENDLFMQLGVTPILHTLKLDYCNLESLDIMRGVGLQTLSLRWNNFSKVPDIPRAIKFIDLSGNPVRNLGPKFLPHLFQLKVLLMEDMPNLESVDDYALFGLPNLYKLSFENSNNLTTFSPNAFGINVILNETDTVLEELNLRGTQVETLNSSLKFAFEILKKLDLGGLPLFCDCNLKWILDLEIDTEGECYNPSHLKGSTITELSSNDFVCFQEYTWLTKLFDGILTILLIIVCAIGIWLIVIGLRPSRKARLQKIGSNSPYARVTIEPNRVENHF